MWCADNIQMRRVDMCRKYALVCSMTLHAQEARGKNYAPFPNSIHHTIIIPYYRSALKYNIYYMHKPKATVIARTLTAKYQNMPSTIKMWPKGPD